ncbi:MAG: tRNA (N(6)-L-threonylcarbamoyladenosine(37)-C(2))-methylthiotransferase MtaB [Saprospiraceae bacterium]|nr:tRNA (N(6)-L-threonylcarbamoyladenosine(37)-C(2))-methylthiotransferase MtaB [Saprospiraceae bacterium]
MATPRSVAFYTLGCKLNYSETSSISRLFENNGYAVREFDEGADVFVINTCSVTDSADKKCRNIVRQALKVSPQAKVIVIGCYAQLKPKEITEIEGVDLVLGAAEKFRIVEFVESIGNATSKGMIMAGDVREANKFVSSFSMGDRTRSFLKVQDGCDYKCSFCTIPMARGASRSDTTQQVIDNAKYIAAQGVKEIVLTGVNLGDFGNGTDVIEGNKIKKNELFIDLIHQLDKVRDIERFRISSIEPNLLTDEIIHFVSESERFVPHFHIPLQSGNNKILAAMRRRYKRELYADRVKLIKTLMPHCCIGVDVIVGFPGEADEDFNETVRFIDSLDVSYLHVFTYSERLNTPAAEMAEVVPMHIRRQRNEILSDLSETKRRAFYKKHQGEMRPMLVEHGHSTEELTGYTDNYIKVSLPYNPKLINQVIPVELGAFNHDGNLIGHTIFNHIPA